jgi:hypothetical protein
MKFWYPLAPERVLKVSLFLPRSHGLSVPIAPDRVLPLRGYVSDSSDSALTLLGIVSGRRSPGAIASSPRRTIT